MAIFNSYVSLPGWYFLRITQYMMSPKKTRHKGLLACSFHMFLRDDDSAASQSGRLCTTKLRRPWGVRRRAVTSREEEDRLVTRSTMGIYTVSLLIPTPPVEQYDLYEYIYINNNIIYIYIYTYIYYNIIYIHTYIYIYS
jgi:hypothetical protein